MIATQSSLLDHIRLERAPMTFDDLLFDCGCMVHVLDFPRDEPDLRRQLRALAEAKPPLARTWESESVEWWEALPETVAADPQKELFS